MPEESLELRMDALRATIVSAFPDLKDATVKVLAGGWDSVALDVDDRLIFKFPRHPEAAARLRKEARLLSVIGPAVDLPVPAMALFEDPILFSRHTKISGEHLLSAQYAELAESDRQQLGETLARFYAQLHAIDGGRLAAAGAVPVQSWLTPAEVLPRVWPVLPEHLRPFAEATITAWANLPPDPGGTIYGFFDGHGWNMAFDHETRRLNGIYDFADSGFGPLHQEFIYSSFISRDLTLRIIAAYAKATGREVSVERVHLLTGTHRLWELAVEADDPDAATQMLASVETWAMEVGRAG